MAGTPTGPGGDATQRPVGRPGRARADRGRAHAPLGLRAVEEALQAEVAALAGVRYAHADGRPGVVRWCQQRGSIYLADQKLPLTVARVRDRAAGREVPLATYQRAAVRDVFGDEVPVQRCQWHERENVTSYLPKSEQPAWRRKLQAAYAHPHAPMRSARSCG